MKQDERIPLYYHYGLIGSNNNDNKKHKELKSLSTLFLCGKNEYA